MSREARFWAWEEAPIDDPRQLLVLLSMADVADEWGGNAFLSVGRMAKDSRSSERTVIRVVKTLIDKGVIEVEKPASQHRPTTYRILMQTRQPVTPEEEPDTPQPRLRGDTEVTPGDSSPSIGTGDGGGIGPRARASEEDVKKDPLLGFDDFWSTYPPRRGRKLNKAKAADQWRKLTLEERRLAWHGAKAMARDVEAGDHLPPDAFRWLRDKLWKDWLEPRQALPMPAAGGSNDPLRGRHAEPLGDMMTRLAHAERPELNEGATA